MRCTPLIHGAAVVAVLVPLTAHAAPEPVVPEPVAPERVVPERVVPGNRPSYAPDVSTTGRYVVFTSEAGNLAPGDTNGVTDIYLRDTAAGTTRLVSKGLNGRAGNGPSFWAKVSSDGRFVSFMSRASNIVAGDTNGEDDVFRADLRTGRIARVNVGPGGTQADAPSEGARMSANGQWIVYASRATTLAPGDTTGHRHIYLWDNASGTTRRISQFVNGDPMRHDAEQPSISPNGERIGFIGATSEADGVFEWRRSTGRPALVRDTTGATGNVRTSDAGTSFSHFVPGTNTYWADIRAAPTAKSFTMYSGDGLPSFDVARWGVVAAAQNHEGLVVVSEAYSLDRDDPAFAPPLARKVTDVGGHLSMSANGSVVAYKNHRQIRAWNWRTGTDILISQS